MKYWINLNKSDAAFANMSAAIKSEKRTNDDEYLKPFPTCQTCPSKGSIFSDKMYWCDKKQCVIDDEFFCKNHPDFAGVK